MQLKGAQRTSAFHTEPAIQAVK